MGKLVFLIFSILFIFLSNFVSASCSEGQIDINSASYEELQEIIWVGPATAENIISERPFECLDDLLRIAYITEGRLEAIKEQGLACVADDEEDSENEDTEDEEGGDDEENSNDENTEDEEESNDEEDEEEINENPNEDEEEKEERNNFPAYLITSQSIKEESPSEDEEGPIVLQRISLSAESKDIKTSDYNNFSDTKKSYPLYGLIGFCVLIGFLFTTKILKNKKYSKNEFQ